MVNKPHTLSMSLQVKSIESVESIDDTSYAVIILGYCAMSGDGEGIPDDVAAVRLTLRKIKYHENIDLAKLFPDTTLNVTITPTQAQLGDFDEEEADFDEGDKSGE
jgi:hypothetical protein